MAEKELIPHLFRTEYSKIVAVLCRIFGLANIQIAEDLVSETFLLAAETWGKKGVPANQVGWLHTVAKNKTKDFLRRDKVFRQKILPELKMSSETIASFSMDLSSEYIEDSQLQMMFAICHPSLPSDAQIGLALRILCGFGISEVAEAFLIKKETVNKRLYRAKEKLRQNKIALVFPDESLLSHRLENVIRVIYLLFNEGYYSRSPNENLKKDLCLEAMRLALLLIRFKKIDLPEVNALIALMSFHASRFEARLNTNGGLVLYADQDRSLWNRDLIKRGEWHLNRAATGQKLSKYHLEAAIAFWHTQEEDPDKWPKILELYNHLLQIEYSPMIALNRTYALAKANGHEAGIKALEKIDLADHIYYHFLQAELWSKKDRFRARMYLSNARKLATTEEDLSLIERKLALL